MENHNNNSSQHEQHLLAAADAYAESIEKNSGTLNDIERLMIKTAFVGGSKWAVSEILQQMKAKG